MSSPQPRRPPSWVRVAFDALMIGGMAVAVVLEHADGAWAAGVRFGAAQRPEVEGPVVLEPEQ